MAKIYAQYERKPTRPKGFGGRRKQVVAPLPYSGSLPQPLPEIRGQPVPSHQPRLFMARYDEKFLSPERDFLQAWARLGSLYYLGLKEDHEDDE